MATKSVQAAPDVQFKRIGIDFKAMTENKEAGTAELDAYASVFNTIDSYGDVVLPGAFTRTLSEWEEKGAPVPVYYNHAIFDNDPFTNLGQLKTVAEDETGLRVTPVLDIEHNEKAAYVYHLAKSGRIRELSIGFITRGWEYGEHDGREVRFIKDVDLLEVSLVPVASNSDATVTEVRSIMAKSANDNLAEIAGAVKDAANAFSESLNTFAEALAASTETDDDDADDAGDGDDAESKNTDGDASDENNPGQPVEGKGGKLPARARAALASIALLGAESENGK